MTPAELNRDIKRLLTKANKVPIDDDSKYVDYVDEVKSELLRLYHADDRFQYMNSKSIKIMLRLNLRFRVIPLHIFGLHIELDKI